jgi:phosphopantetheinyl transferase (holo-ACP synthase)
MRIREVLGGIYVIITEEENELVTKFFSENEYVNENQLSDRESIIADRLTHKGVLMPTLRGYRTV